MPSLNITRRPYTEVVYYLQNGVYQNEDVELAIDACDSDVWFYFRTNLAKVAGNALQYAETNIGGINPLAGFTPIVVPDGSTYTIFSQVFTTSSAPIENQFFSNPAGTIAGSKILADSLADLINTNAQLNWRYYARSYEVIPGSGWAVNIRAKYYGSVYNINDVDITGTGGLTTGVFGDTQFALVFANDTTQSMRLQSHRYGVFVEVWEVLDVERMISEDEQSNTTANGGSSLALPYGIKPTSTLVPARLLGTLSQNWTTEDEFKFEISRYLKSTVKAGIVNPYSNLVGTSAAFYMRFAVKAYFLKYGDYYIGGYDPLTNFPAETNPNAITNTDLKRHYQGETPIRWTSRGAYPVGEEPNPYNFKWRSVVRNPFVVGNNNIVRLGVSAGTNFVHPALTNCPKIKLRRRTLLPTTINTVVYEPEPLHFILHNDQENIGINPMSFRVLVRATMTDGSTNNNFCHVFVMESNNANGMYYIDMRLDSLNLLTTETTTVRIRYIRCEVQSSFNGVNWQAYSVPFYYELDLNTELTDTYTKIFFLNKYSVLDSFEFEGNREYDIKTKESTYRSTITPQYRDFYYDYRDTTQYDSWRRHKSTTPILKTSPQKEFTVNTGWVDREHISWLQELVQSPALYVRKDHVQHTYNISGGSALSPNITIDLQAITLTGYSIKHNDTDDLFNLEITYTCSQPDEEITYG